MACAEAIIKVAKILNIKGLKIAVVVGDDIKERIDELVIQGEDLNNMETGESIVKVKDKLLVQMFIWGGSYC